MNTNKIRYPSIMHMLEAQDPESIALTYDDEGTITNLTFSEVKEEVLLTSIDKTKKCVGILCDGSLSTLFEIMAYIHNKITIVLLSPNDKKELIQEQINAVGIDYIVGDSIYKDELIPVDVAFAPRNKIIFFTSGTTNKAKGVILTEEKVCAAAYNGSSCLELSPKDELLCCLPLNHVFGFVCSWLWAWENGASIILSRGIKQVFFDFKYFRPTACALVPQMAAFLTMRRLFNQELKLVLIGAGDCPDSVLEAIYHLGIRVSFGYGLTETASGVALSLGKNPRAFTVCPLDEVVLGDDDEILVHCPETIFEGYFPDNSGYNDLFDDAGYFKTGDLGYYDGDLLLHLSGRKKDILVLSDGTKMYLPDIEKKLLKDFDCKELALGMDKNMNVVVAIGKIKRDERGHFEDKVEAYNNTVPRGERITKIIALPYGLPRNQAGKVKRYEIDFDEC